MYVFSHVIQVVIISILRTPAQDRMCSPLHAIYCMLKSILLTPAVRKLDVLLLPCHLTCVKLDFLQPAVWNWMCPIPSAVLGVLNSLLRL